MNITSIAWLALATVVFTERSSVGVWAFSSKEQAQLVDRAADGPIIWHSLTLAPPQLLQRETSREEGVS
ncbi:hypothetical protein [Rhizobium sp.]|uniref:hypothetical protein n=1 Tax=Rhizobium sp. TaxID=391 RepID=UPI0028984546